MDKFVKKLVNNHLEVFMNKSIGALALADETYLHDSKAADKPENGAVS